MPVAISIPVHNWTPQFRASLGSIKAQTPEAEVALMMTHEDPQILEDIEASNLSFSYSRTGPDQGQAAAIAEGWAKTHSPILAWLNTDDALVSSALVEALTAFEHDPDLDVYYGQSTISDTDNDILGLHPAVQPPSKLLRRTNIISQPSCFIRRRALNDIGGLNPGLDYTMDWDIWLRLFENGAKMMYSDHILSNVTWTAGTKTAKLNSKRLIEFSEILRRSQSLWKTTLGLSALYRSHRKTYTSGANLSQNCKPLATIRTHETLPVINMHGENKSKLSIYSERQLVSVDIGTRDFSVEHREGHSLVSFLAPVSPGDTITITLSPMESVTRLSWN